MTDTTATTGRPTTAPPPVATSDVTPPTLAALKLAALPYLIKRSLAAQLASVTVRTVDRWERTDPNIPARVGLGPGGNAPYAYVSREWTEYLAALPRIPRPTGVREAERDSAAPRGELKAAGQDIPKNTPCATPKGTAKAPKASLAATPKADATGTA